MEQKESRYFWQSYFREIIQKTEEFKLLENEISKHGFFTIDKDNVRVKIYTSGLFYLFLMQVILVKNTKKKALEVINTSDFLNTYIKAFQEGREHFSNYWAIDTKTLSEGKTEAYVKDLHWNYYHNPIESKPYEGWNFVRKLTPVILNDLAFYDFGYYAGIISEADRLMNDNAELFKHFNNCEIIVETKAEVNENANTRRIF